MSNQHFESSIPIDEGKLARTARRFTVWAEHWFPDSFAFAAVAVVIVASAALANGASPTAVAGAFGKGFWSLITFTMQLAMLVVSGYVLAVSAPIERLIEALARVPRTGRGAVGFVAFVAMAVSLLNWAMSLIVGGLLVRACARRPELRMDYRAAGAAAYLGLGATWAMGISSVAAQLQADAASLPPAILTIAGAIPLTETVLCWQSMATLAAIFLLSFTVALKSAPTAAHAVTAQTLEIDLERPALGSTTANRPGEWIEHSPLLTLALVAIGGFWLVETVAAQGLIAAFSSLNTYNFLFLMTGLLCHWRPRRFLAAVAKAVPSAGGVLIQFPLYGAVAGILTGAPGGDGLTLSDHLAHAFTQMASAGIFPVAMGLYSTILGIFVPSGGGKWVLAAPHVLQAAVDLRINPGWTVQLFNAIAMSNLINPFFMLPLLGILGLQARDIVGFTFLQFLWHLPVMLFVMWALSFTFA